MAAISWGELDITIQVVAQNYYPDNFRINDITAELVRQGHTVRVLTGLPDYSTSTVPKDYRFFRNRHQIVDGVAVTRVFTVARRKGVFFRILSYMSFMLTASLNLSFCLHPQSDVIFVYQLSPVFQILPAVVLKRRTKKLLAVYCCDLWPESMKAWGLTEKTLAFKLVKLFSAWLYRQADIVAITSRPFKEYLQNVCGVEESKIVYLPQHCEDDYAEIACQYEDNKCVDFLFAGNIGAVQDVDVILQAVARIKTKKLYRVHIVGDGSELEACKALAAQLAITERVIFHGRYPIEKMKDFYRLADCFLLTLRGGDFIGMTLPSKAQSYLCAGKPIVAAIDGAGYELITDANCGEAAVAGDINGLASKMTTIIENTEEYKAKGYNGRQFYEQHFTKQIYVDNLLCILRGSN